MFYHKSYKYIRWTKVKALCMHLAVLGVLFGVLFGVNVFVANAQNTRNDTPTLPGTLDNYANPNLPNHFNDNDIENLDNTPNNNPVTDAGATLGRVLFYETNLSIDRTVSCGSCHFQENGFADPAQFSQGVNGLTGRNSMGLANNRYYNNGRYFWDERAVNLETQVLLPVQDQIEMGLPFDQIVPRIQEKDYYGPLFTAAFGDSTINTDRISRAMAQFIRSMVSYESRLDQALAAGNLQGLTQLEREGRRIFNGQGRCDNCHREEVQAARQTHNNGLDAVLTDLGEGAVTGNNNDNGKFKVPSLRNIAETGPYMHDGRFDTLEEVVNFYNSQVQNSPNLDRQLRNNNGPRRLNLNNNERNALVAYMRTFSDQSFMTDPKFSDPFAANGDDPGQVDPVDPIATPVPTATPTATPSTPSNPVTGANLVYLSSTSGGNIDGVPFNDEDIMAYDINSGTWSMVFDGSDVGIGGSDVDAFTVVDSDSILLSLQRSLNMSAQGLGTVDDSDILEFTGTFGEDTSGTWSLYFDGSDVGLTSNSEDIDAVALDSNGDLLVSTTGTASIPGMTGRGGPRDEDVLRFTATSLGNNTSGSWSRYFDGSDMDLANSGNEDIWGIWVNANTNAIYLTTRGDFNAQGDSNSLAGDVADIFMCTPGSIGNNTDCVLSAFWDGDNNGFGGERPDAIAVAPASVLAVRASGLGVLSSADVVLEEDQFDNDPEQDIFIPIIQR